MSQVALKITHILYAGLGGQGADLFALIEKGFLENASHNVIFVGIEEPRFEYVVRCDALNIPWTYIARIKSKSYLGFVFALFKRLSLIEPDIVLSHGLTATPSLTLYRVFSSRKRFLVLRDTQAHHLKRIQDWVFLFLANSLFDRIVYLTEEARSGAKAKLRYFYRGAKSVVINNGLDTEYFSPGSRPNVSNGIRIGMQSRLQANKDHPTLIDAFNALTKMQPELNLSLHIAGDGETLGPLRNYVETLGLSGRVFFHGMLGQSELRDFLSGLSIYVHSTHGETMSTAIMQALSMGLPVIASDVLGVSNMIKGGNGLLYRPGDATDLAAKVNSVIQDQSLLASLSMHARQGAVENYCNAAYVEKHNEVFRSNG